MLTRGITKICSEYRKGREAFVTWKKFIVNKVISPVIVIAFFVHETL